MTLTLKPLHEQVLVITGASSGIGLVTAKMAARQGARVVLAARNESDLRRASDEIRRAGGRAIHVVADVSDPRQVEAIAAAAIREFGRIDTWVNNAAVAIYGLALEIPVEDLRRQFDVNFWGVVYGSRAAVPHLRERGGALVNVGSVLSDRAIPLQANYCAAKHAVKGFTEALRMELEKEGAPVSVTLVKPSSIDTPFFDKAKSYMGVEPQPVPPVYAPEIVAEAILHAASHPIRDVFAGAAGKMMAVGNMTPRLTDKYMERMLFRQQKTDKPVGGRADNLYAAVANDGGERGMNWEGRTKGTSVYTKSVLHPWLSAGLVSGIGLALAASALAWRSSAASE
jgi:NAD(P)-dependent dehydrogenase (short-subunit alcohol dehydrogenase family)